MMLAFAIMCVAVATCALSLELNMGFRSRTMNLFRRVTGRGGGVNTLLRTDAELKSGIAKFYDESSSIWLDVLGEGTKIRSFDAESCVF